ncbi:MAG: polyphenol oxidase family protein [Bdellovibrionales bacterium]|nr:polyphenol oxidase family protein [Bdellovibrionales bacterium]
MHFESTFLRNIPNIVHGFGTRSDPVPTPVLKNWVELRPEWNQVAGTEIANVVRRNQACGDVDGFFTKTTNPIGVRAADCVPILLARKDGGMVAALHAGWRGTKAKITEKLAKTLLAQGEDLSQWVAAIGPAIGACCYEVGEDLIEDFVKTFPEIEPDMISPTHRKLDLSAINQFELERLGFGQVDWIPECTYCSMDKSKGAHFHSYRREGSGTRQWSIIARKA